MTDLDEMPLVFAAPAPTRVEVAGEDALFPVRRIYCVGRNYAAHIREMGGDERQLPFFFQKPTDCIVANGGSVPYPPRTSDFQYEAELVLAIGTGGKDIAVEAAAAHVFGVAVGIDLTRRDLQLEARNSGRPWESGKSFDRSAPISAIHPTRGGALPAEGAIELRVDGEVKQKADLAEMIWSADEIVSHLSALYELQPGDIIYTGTPAGVGPVQRGSEIRVTVEGVDELVTHIV